MSIKKSLKVRTALLLIISIFLGYSFLGVLLQLNFGEVKGLGKYFLENNIKDTQSANSVTSVVVNYRGFDTLGEVTVLFLAATGLGAILSGERKTKRKKVASNTMLRIGAKVLLGFFLVVGSYVFIHGHLSPGGGFQGGVIIATGFLIMSVSYRSYKINHKVISIIEGLAGITFVTLGIFGLIYGGSFLFNFLPLGKVGNLFSAGVIPLIYTAVGFKVGSELTGVVRNLMGVVEWYTNLF